MSALWGEIVSDAGPSIPPVEREQITKLRTMEVEGPALHQPSSLHQPPTTEPYPAELFNIDALTHHTICLVQYARRVRGMLLTVHQQVEAAKTEDKELPQFNPAPPLPEYNGPTPKHQLQKPLPFLSKDFKSDFVLGIGREPPEIDSKSCRKLLRRSVAALCAHVGFDNCAESVLETFTDLTNDYLMRFTAQMRQAVDREALCGATGFPDVMEQVFHEMGVGSMLCLHDFYQTRVIKYHQHMLHTCQTLRDDYDRLRHPDIKSLSDLKPLLKVKEESSDGQFTSVEDNEEEGEQSAHLEGGQESVSGEEDGGGQWQPPSKPDSVPADTRPDCYEVDASQQAASSEASSAVAAITGGLGDSVQPSSVPDYMTSPPVIASQNLPPPYKRKKRDH